MKLNFTVDTQNQAEIVEALAILNGFTPEKPVKATEPKKKASPKPKPA